jgi:hypothetical protein
VSGPSGDLFSYLPKRRRLGRRAPEKRERNKRLNQNEEAGRAAIDNLFLYSRFFCYRQSVRKSGHHADKRSSQDHCSEWTVPDDQQLHSGRKQFSARSCDCNIRYPNPRANSNAYTVANSYCHSDSSHSHPHADSNTDADADADANADSYSDANTASANGTDCINRQLNRTAGIY